MKLNRNETLALIGFGFFLFFGFGVYAIALITGWSYEQFHLAQGTALVSFLLAGACVHFSLK
jgi:hypothetical protein